MGLQSDGALDLIVEQPYDIGTPRHAIPESTAIPAQVSALIADICCATCNRLSRTQNLDLAKFT
jgi:hypothetical protein